jgi:hypothetical protein
MVGVDRARYHLDKVLPDHCSSAMVSSKAAASKLGLLWPQQAPTFLFVSWDLKKEKNIKTILKKEKQSNILSNNDFSFLPGSLKINFLVNLINDNKVYSLVWKLLLAKMRHGRNIYSHV